MIDLHTHILPGIDDGSATLEQSLEMAKIAVDDGITLMACTPHIYPGLYMNDAAGISLARDKLQNHLNEADINLQLVIGADAHLVPELLSGLKSGRVPTLNNSRYFLLEPSHHVAVPNFDNSVFEIMAAGYMPVITHPERLTWIEDHYAMFVDVAKRGAWIQITAGAILGKFGSRAQYWSEKLLSDGVVHIIASDAHNTGRRSPKMAEAYEQACKRVGKLEATRMVYDRPKAILIDAPPENSEPVPGLQQLELGSDSKKSSFQKIKAFFNKKS
jgi:protein-tyrosine phosphatase